MLIECLVIIFIYVIGGISSSLYEILFISVKFCKMIFCFGYFYGGGD